MKTVVGVGYYLRTIKRASCEHCLRQAKTSKNAPSHSEPRKSHREPLLENTTHLRHFVIVQGLGTLQLRTEEQITDVLVLRTREKVVEVTTRMSERISERDVKSRR